MPINGLEVDSGGCITRENNIITITGLLSWGSTPNRSLNSTLYHFIKDSYFIDDQTDDLYLDVLDTGSGSNDNSTSRSYTKLVLPSSTFNNIVQTLGPFYSDGPDNLPLFVVLFIKDNISKHLTLIETMIDHTPSSVLSSMMETIVVYNGIEYGPLLPFLCSSYLYRHLICSTHQYNSSSTFRLLTLHPHLYDFNKMIPLISYLVKLHVLLGIDLSQHPDLILDFIGLGAYASTSYDISRHSSRITSLSPDTEFGISDPASLYPLADYIGLEDDNNNAFRIYMQTAHRIIQTTKLSPRIISSLSKASIRNRCQSGLFTVLFDWGIVDILAPQIGLHLLPCHGDSTLWHRLSILNDDTMAFIRTLCGMVMYSGNISFIMGAVGHQHDRTCHDQCYKIKDDTPLDLLNPPDKIKNAQPNCLLGCGMSELVPTMHPYLFSCKVPHNRTSTENSVALSMSRSTSHYHEWRNVMSARQTDHIKSRMYYHPHSFDPVPLHIAALRTHSRPSYLSKQKISALLNSSVTRFYTRIPIQWCPHPSSGNATTLSPLLYLIQLPSQNIQNKQDIVTLWSRMIISFDVQSRQAREKQKSLATHQVVSSWPSLAQSAWESVVGVFKTTNVQNDEEKSEIITEGYAGSGRSINLRSSTLKRITQTTSVSTSKFTSQSSNASYSLTDSVSHSYTITQHSSRIFLDMIITPYENILHQLSSNTAFYTSQELCALWKHVLDTIIATLVCLEGDKLNENNKYSFVNMVLSMLFEQTSRFTLNNPVVDIVQNLEKALCAGNSSQLTSSTSVIADTDLLHFLSQYYPPI